MNTFNSALHRFGEVTVRLSVELGRTEMPLKDVLSLTEGSVVALDRLTDELLDVTANGRVVARGEVVAQDGKFALRIVSMVDDAVGPDLGGGAFAGASSGPKPDPIPEPAPAPEPAPPPPAEEPEGGDAAGNEDGAGAGS